MMHRMISPFISTLNKTRVPSMEQCAECIHRICTSVYTTEICLAFAPEVLVQQGYRCWLSAVANLTYLRINTKHHGDIPMQFTFHMALELYSCLPQISNDTWSKFDWPFITTVNRIGWYLIILRRQLYSPYVHLTIQPLLVTLLSVVNMICIWLDSPYT